MNSYIEAKIILVTDSWPDRNAIKDAMQIGIPVIALCDTNNQSNCIDLVVPCNNKGKKSLGLFFYLVARDYLIQKGTIKTEEEMRLKLDDFMEE